MVANRFLRIGTAWTNRLERWYVYSQNNLIQRWHSSLKTHCILEHHANISLQAQGDRLPQLLQEGIHGEGHSCIYCSRADTQTEIHQPFISVITFVYILNRTLQSLFLNLIYLSLMTSGGFCIKA